MECNDYFNEMKKVVACNYLKRIWKLLLANTVNYTNKLVFISQKVVKDAPNNMFFLSIHVYLVTRYLRNYMSN